MCLAFSKQNPFQESSGFLEPVICDIVQMRKSRSDGQLRLGLVILGVERNPVQTRGQERAIGLFAGFEVVLTMRRSRHKSV